MSLNFQKYHFLTTLAIYTMLGFNLNAICYTGRFLGFFRGELTFDVVLVVSPAWLNQGASKCQDYVLNPKIAILLIYPTLYIARGGGGGCSSPPPLKHYNICDEISAARFRSVPNRKNFICLVSVRLRAYFETKLVHKNTGVHGCMY